MLRRRKFQKQISDQTRERILDVIAAAALIVEPVEAVTDCRDRKDNMYLELALAANAMVIVSSDDDLLSLDPWRGIRIVRPCEYLRHFASGNGSG